MKFRVTAVGYSDDVTPARRDVSLIVDVTSTVREVASGLVRAGWADANDTPSLFTVAFTHAKRADYPPGRGFLVQGGHRTGVHIATPEGR